MGERITIQGTIDGRWPSVSLPTGDSHTIVLRFPTLQLERRYHDDAPVQGAPFTVRLADGSEVEGALDENGRAELKDLPAAPGTVRFGPDARSYRRMDDRKNPQYKAEPSATDADALVRRRLARS